MNRAAMLLLILTLTLGLSVNGFALDSDTIRQMKDLKAIMDEMPESTTVKPKIKVKEEIKEPIIKDVQEEMEIKAEIEDISAEMEDNAEVMSEAEAQEDEMDDDSENQGFVFTNENNLISLDDEELLDEATDQLEDGTSMNNISDDIVTTEDDEWTDVILSDISEEAAETAESVQDMAEDKVTVMDMINDAEVSSTDIIEEQGDPSLTEVKVTDFEVEISEDAEPENTMEMVEYREDLADEISEEITEINLEIEEIEGAIDQEISDLRQDLDQLSETNLDEDLSSDY